MIGQEFVDTGPHPTSYRVMTVFGRPTYSLASIALEERPALDPYGTEPLDLPIASNAGARRLEMNFAKDILELGSAVYRACPTVPVHGVDIVREAETGRLFVLEFNPSGLTWHLSSPYFALARESFNLSLYAQFDALAIVAEALIEKTRSEAI
jgi:hypothetical protein